MNFKCAHCAQKVTTHNFQRNHCPFCLFSLHVDQEEAGDRKSDCKSLMPPIGLTFKKIKDKFKQNKKGELMLVHRCLKCGKFSINRLAADDDPKILQEIFNQKISPEDKENLEKEGITPLEEKKDSTEFKKQLSGN